MYAEKTDYDDIEMSSRLWNILRRSEMIWSMESDLMTFYVWMHLELE